MSARPRSWRPARCIRISQCSRRQKRRAMRKSTRWSGEGLLAANSYGERSAGAVWLRDHMARRNIRNAYVN